MNYERQTWRYLELAEQMLDDAFGAERGQWIRRVEGEVSQIRRVFAWLKAQRDAERGLKLAYLLQEVWFEEQYTEEGLEIMQDFLAMPEAAEPSTKRAMCLDLAGALALGLDQLELARSLKAQAVAIFRKLGHQRQLGYALLHQGHLIGYGKGDYREAATTYREALGIFIDLSDGEGIAHATANLASAALELGDHVTAKELVDDSLRKYVELNSQWDLALTVANAAGVAAAQGDFERATRLAAASAAHRERIGVSLPGAMNGRLKRIEDDAGSGLDEDQRSLAWVAGEAMTLAEAVDFALSADAGSGQ